MTMRRHCLPPPTPVRADPTHEAVEPWPWAGAGAATHDLEPAPSHGRLADPVPAVERRRPLFHPARGWVRRAERESNLWLSRFVFPRIPGLHLPYDRLLRRDLMVSEASVHVAGLPSRFDGFRLLLITDVHAGPFVSPAVLTQAFERLMLLTPDAIMIGGDFVTSRVIEFRTHLQAFRRLQAPHGVFAVLGNHDHYTEDPARLARWIDRSGLRLLHNRSTAIRLGDQRISLAGVDDALVGRPDLDAALVGARPPVVLLSHHPDLFFQAARRGISLVLSGHTHGGQIRIPGLPVLVRQSRYRLDEGRFVHGPTELIVSRGLGVVGLPWRLACPPEAVLVTLSCGAVARGDSP